MRVTLLAWYGKTLSLEYAQLPGSFQNELGVFFMHLKSRLVPHLLIGRGLSQPPAPSALPPPPLVFSENMNVLKSIVKSIAKADGCGPEQQQWYTE